MSKNVAAFIPSRWRLGFHFTDRERRCFWGSQQGCPRPCCSRILYQIRCWLSNAKPACWSIFRALLVCLLSLSVPVEPRFPLQHLSVKGDTISLVVHLLASETLVARHVGRTGQSDASTVVRAGVIVVCHCFALCLVLYVPHYTVLSAIVNPPLHIISQNKKVF